MVDPLEIEKISGPWSGQTDPIWLLTILSLSRNLEGHLFPRSMQEKELAQITQEIQRALGSSPLFSGIMSCDLSSLSPQQKEFLSEKLFLTKNPISPAPYQQIFLDKEEKFMALTNGSDHLSLNVYMQSPNFLPTWSYLSSLDDLLAEKLPFAFDESFGYLTSDLSSCGTGLKVESYLHLPALIHLEGLEELTTELEGQVLFSGLGENSSFLADIVIIENRFKLGVTEESILSTIEKASTTLINAEKKLRSSSEPQFQLLLKDKIARSFGLLRNAIQLKTNETLSALSMVELGKQMEWIKGEHSNRFSDLFFTSLRSHLDQQANKTLNADELKSQRASLMREVLSSLKLNI